MMEDLKRYIAAEGAAPAPDAAQVDALLSRHEWFTAARAVREHLTATTDRVLAAVAAGRCVSSLKRRQVDVQKLAAMTADDIIDRFLRHEDLRIVADETTEDKDVTTEPDIAGEDDVVSEQLAKIYAAQGLNEQAIEIYRKLSLLNTEKSVYFAELIGKLEKIKE